jgi:hypothetical protein
MPADYFVSYTAADRAWAEWIAWTLEDAGATVTLQAWDFGPGSNFIVEMQRAAADARRTIAVLSPEYLESQFAAPEWAAAFAQDPEGFGRKLVPVRVRDCALDGMLKAIVHIDLVGSDETTARQRLCDGLMAQRAKPARAPAFPGSAAAQKPDDHPKPFPGGGAVSAAGSSRSVPYVPKIRGAISDLDRTRFVKRGFQVIQEHFNDGLSAMAATNKAVDVDLTRRSETEFVAEVYVNGQRAARCRIWLGGMMGGSDEIGYYEGNYDAGNSLNEALTLTDAREDLALRAMMNMGLGASRLPPGLNPNRMTAEEAAEYLWCRYLWQLQ